METARAEEGQSYCACCCAIRRGEADKKSNEAACASRSGRRHSNTPASFLCSSAAPSAFSPPLARLSLPCVFVFAICAAVVWGNRVCLYNIPKQRMRFQQLLAFHVHAGRGGREAAYSAGASAASAGGGESAVRSMNSRSSGASASAVGGGSNQLCGIDTGADSLGS